MCCIYYKEKDSLTTNGALLTTHDVLPSTTNNGALPSTTNNGALMTVHAKRNEAPSTMHGALPAMPNDAVLAASARYATAAQNATKYVMSKAGQ